MRISTVVCLLLLPLTAGAYAGADKKEPKVTVGMMAPDLPLEGAKNHASLATFRGKPVLIHIWATWCPTCTESMPVFANIAELFKKTDLVVLMLDHDTNHIDSQLFLMQQHIAWPDYHDEHGRFLRAFGHGGIPITVLIDRDGVVQYHHTGAGLSEKTEQKLLQAVDKAIKTPAGAAPDTANNTP